MGQCLLKLVDAVYNLSRGVNRMAERLDEQQLANTRSQVVKALKAIEQSLKVPKSVQRLERERLEFAIQAATVKALNAIEKALIAPKSPPLVVAEVVGSAEEGFREHTRRGDTRTPAGPSGQHTIFSEVVSPTTIPLVMTGLPRNPFADRVAKGERLVYSMKDHYHRVVQEKKILETKQGLEHCQNYSTLPVIYPWNRK